MLSTSCHLLTQTQYPYSSFQALPALPAIGYDTQSDASSQVEQTGQCSFAWLTAMTQSTLDLSQSCHDPRSPFKDFAEDWRMRPKTVDHGRRKRKGFPKSRSGCSTCKARHVKCDEGKPACRTCAKSGRQCDGYSNSLRCRRPARARIIFVYWQPKTPTLTRRQPSVALAGNQKECRAFDFFRSKSAVQLSGIFDAGFWSRLVPQASHDEPIIQHAVIALSALYETIHKTEADYLKNKEKVYSSFALQQYNKAITLLHRDLRLHGQRSIAIALISCVLFIALESMQGNYDASVTHLRSGLSLFRAWQAESIQPTASETGSASFFMDQEGMDSELITMFTRLNHTALIYIDTRLCPTDILAHEKQLRVPVPKCFQNLSEARNWLGRCVCLIVQNAIFKKQYREYPGSSDPQTVETHRQLVFQWLSAFQAFIASARIGIGHKDFQGVLLLELQSRAVIITAKVGMSPKETDYDAFDAEFESIVSLASSLINDFEVEYPTLVGGTPQYSFERGALFVMWLVASKCRDPWIRRQALALLSAMPRQECFWSSHMFSKVAERIIQIEEDVEDISDIKISKSNEVVVRLTLAQTTIYSDERKVLANFIRTKSGISEEGIQNELITY